MNETVSEERLDLLKELEAHLSENVIGQGNVIPPVTEALLDGELGLTDPARPKGTFLFLGPTGVGKTELCLCFTRFLFGNQGLLARFDMSEFQTQESLGILLGGKLGERGLIAQRIDAIGQRGTILFDEIEKAHPRVLDILLQILDAARITMADGSILDLSGYYVVGTSNIASHAILESRRCVRSTLVRFIERQAQAQLRPEVFARFETVAVFDRLEYAEIGTIAKHLLRQEIKRHQQQGYHFSYDERTIQHLIGIGFDARLGARPMRTQIERFVRRAIRETLFQGTSKVISLAP